MREILRTIEASDGTSLHVTEWWPEGEPKFAVLVSHGQSEHLGRHRWLGEALTEAGGVVFGPDHRGEGRSGGHRGHTESFDQYAADLSLVAEEVQGTLPPDLPMVLFAHSMGGLIGLLFLLDHGERLAIQGAVISAPLLELGIDIGTMKRVLARIANVVMPRIAIKGELRSSEVLADPELIKLYDEDPLRTMTVTPRWAKSMEHGQARVRQEVSRLKLPMLWYAGNKDRVCSTPVAQKVFESLPRASELDQVFEELDGVLHEPHNELPERREAIRKRAIDWLVHHALA